MSRWFTADNKKCCSECKWFIPVDCSYESGRCRYSPGSCTTRVYEYDPVCSKFESDGVPRVTVGEAVDLAISGEWPARLEQIREALKKKRTREERV